MFVNYWLMIEFILKQKNDNGHIVATANDLIPVQWFTLFYIALLEWL